MRRTQLIPTKQPLETTMTMQWLLPRNAHRSCQNLDALLKNFLRAASPTPARELNTTLRTHQILAHL